MVSCTPTRDLPSPRHRASQGESGCLGFAEAPQGFLTVPGSRLRARSARSCLGGEDPCGIGRKRAGRGEKRPQRVS